MRDISRFVPSRPLHGYGRGRKGQVKRGSRLRDQLCIHRTRMVAAIAAITLSACRFESEGLGPQSTPLEQSHAGGASESGIAPPLSAAPSQGGARTLSQGRTSLRPESGSMVPAVSSQPGTGGAVSSQATTGGTSALPQTPKGGAEVNIGTTEMPQGGNGNIEPSRTSPELPAAGGQSSTARSRNSDGEAPIASFGGTGSVSNSSTSRATGGARANHSTVSNGNGGERCTAGRFQQPQTIMGLLPEGYDYFGPSLSADGLSLYFAASKDGDEDDIYVSSRTTQTADFEAAVVLSGVNTVTADGSPNISSDGLTLYFYSTRAGGLGGRDLYTAQRATLDAPFRGVQHLDGVNGPEDDYLPWISSDGLTLVYTSTRSGGSDLFLATRPSTSSGFSSPTELAGVNTENREDRAALSSDGLTLYFVSDRPNGVGDKDIWVAQRNDIRSAFSNPTVLDVVNSEARDIDVSLSADNRELFFASKRSGEFRLYRSVWGCPGRPLE